MKKLLLLPFVLSFIMCNKNEEQPNKKDENKENVVQNVILTQEENKLYDLLMEYRKDKGLDKIPISRSLTIVAQTHAKDLAINKPDKGECNMHSWSDKGNWTPVCYTLDHKNAKLMWSKPQELTSYKGYGYEISASSSSNITALQALNLWKRSSGHNDVIINNGIWKSSWNSIGIGIYNEYAVVWFGKEKDDEN